jgi:hypothetical protein
MKRTAIPIAIFFISFASRVSAEFPGRWVIEVYDFSVDVATADKEEGANILATKIKRLSEQVSPQCADLSSILVNVDKLEVQKRGKPFLSFAQMDKFWHKDDTILEIIDGNMLAKKDPSEMWSDVHLFDLKGSLGEATITIPTEMTGPNFEPLGDLHCAVALYALAMDLKLRYASLTDSKAKKLYIQIISRYLSQIPRYLPPPKPAPSELEKRQEEESNTLWKAAQKELDWCKSEDGKI